MEARACLRLGRCCTAECHPGVHFWSQAEYEELRYKFAHAGNLEEGGLCPWERRY